MSNVSINDSAVQNLFQALNTENRNQIILTALRAGGNKLAQNTRASLKSKLGAGASTPNRWNGKPMESGVRCKADKDYNEVTVSIMGDFRLKFFEKGTKVRQTRKTGANRGSIKALNFFSSARADEGSITDNIYKSIEASLKRITRQ